MEEWSPRQLTVLAGMLFFGIVAVVMEQGTREVPQAAPSPAEVFARRSPFPKVPSEVMDSLAAQPSSSVRLRTLGAPIEEMKDSVVDVSTKAATAAAVPSPPH